MIRNRYIRKHAVHVCINIEKCNYRLGVDMNTEAFLIIPDKVVRDV